jgi:hypothetical protein
MIGDPISADTWKKELMPNDVAPIWADAIVAWNNRFMMHKFECVYSSLDKVKATEKDIEYNSSYVWIGCVPSQIAEDKDSKEVHCAILIVRRDKYELVHTLSPGVFYTEHLSEKEFIFQTYMVYQISGVYKWRSI